MEKRALLALVLSLAVLLFWQYYFGLFQSTPTSTQQETGTTAPPTTQPATASTAPPALPPGAGSLPKDQLANLDKNIENWVAESPFYRAQIASPGARMASLQLRKFRTEVDPQSPPMEVVPARSTGYLPLAVDLLQHQAWQLSTRPYTGDAQHSVTVSPDDKSKSLTFDTEIPGQVKVSKIYTFRPESYIVDLEVRMKNLSSEDIVDQMGLSFYFQPYDDPSKETSYNISQLSVFEKGNLSIHTPKDLEKQELVLKSPLEWIGYENNFFLQALVPIDTSGYQVVSRVLDPAKGLIRMVYLTDAFQLPAGQEKSYQFKVYMGPKDLGYLNAAGHNLAAAVDYGWFTVIAKPMIHILNWLYKYTHNYGIAIILLTIAIKIIFWPLTQKSYKSMQMMKKIQPKIQQIREKYKDDREKLNQELMQAYRTYKVNPMGGCLPMVLQIPVFFALYRMLNGAVELRHEPFMLWMNDLTAPDRLHIGIDIPYLGGIPVLTLLMGISMFIQQKMTPTGGDPRQEKMMLLMPVVFTFFFINFPSGLVLYWLVNNVLSIAQQYWINRHA
ncbi:MAG: membrane protein insertase YidC [Syntrophobacteraceae bacterium]